MFGSEAKVIAFKGDRKNVVIPDTITLKSKQYPVTWILNAFSSKNIVSVKMPDTIKYISGNAFEESKSLETINLSKNLISIGNFAFYHCTSLKQINLPSSLTNIGEFAFTGSGIAGNITIPDAVGTIGDSAFKDCKNITEISITTAQNSNAKLLDNLNKKGTATYQVIIR